MTEFPHQHTAHCETGVMSTLLKHHGLDLNEAMVFGLGHGLAFVYLPVIKLSGMPLISYRSQPRSIIKNVCKLLNIKMDMQKFSSPQQGQAGLDKAVAAGKLVGLQTSVFWLPYFPSEMRFHFNAHNLLVYGKEGSEYLISDPVFECVQRCAAEDLQRARFAKGALAAKGLMYSIESGMTQAELQSRLPGLIHDAICKNAKQMLPPAPVFFAGARGIRMLAQKIEDLPASGKDGKYQKLYLGHIVRMQEEIGTGGAGFRYLYAYFLEQAAEICNNASYRTASRQLTEIGDEWRKFASMCVRQCKKPLGNGCWEIAHALRRIADREEALWRSLLRK